MKYNLQITDMAISATDRKLLDKKLSRLEKHLQPPYTAAIRLKHDKHHIKGSVITCTINIKEGKKVFHASREAEVAQTAADEAIGAVAHELYKYNDKRNDNRKLSQ